MNYKTVLMIIGYFLLINLIGFLAMYIDKKRAKRQEWRIKEWTLISIAILGGGIGDLIGMYKFRHKTKKAKFTVGIPAIMILQIALIATILIDNPFKIWM